MVFMVLKCLCLYLWFVWCSTDVISYMSMLQIPWDSGLPSWRKLQKLQLHNFLNFQCPNVQYLLIEWIFEYSYQISLNWWSTRHNRFKSKYTEKKSEHNIGSVECQARIELDPLEDDKNYDDQNNPQQNSIT